MSGLETESPEKYPVETEQESLLITHLDAFEGEAVACKIKESIKRSTKFIVPEQTKVVVQA